MTTRFEILEYAKLRECETVDELKETFATLGYRNLDDIFGHPGFRSQVQKALDGTLEA